MMGARRKKAEPEPVAPNTVRVWRGFINPGTDYSQFADFLGQIFVPGCALLQPNAGLRAYVPAMPSQKNKPAAVPDQTALMWWATTTAHDEATKTPAVRIYQSLHSDAYNMKVSKSDVPLLFAGTLTADQSYYFFKNKADWMLGTVRHLVGAPKSPANFLQTLQTWAAAYQAKPPKGVDGALILAGTNNSYVAFWEHWTGKAKSSPLDDLAKTVTPYLNATAENIPPGGGLWSNWPGWDLTRHTCMNVQLDRPKKK
ncbi:MAG TPA: hypothetical protein VKB93_18335 [Thermoanaerobaculia bacterium]|nr:hypothetical protein [Thermoanaerobaculia bacterium]